jgi:hypothetical protein
MVTGGSSRAPLAPADGMVHADVLSGVEVAKSSGGDAAGGPCLLVTVSSGWMCTWLHGVHMARRGTCSWLHPCTLCFISKQHAAAAYVLNWCTGCAAIARPVLPPCQAFCQLPCCCNATLHSSLVCQT